MLHLPVTKLLVLAAGPGSDTEHKAILTQGRSQNAGSEQTYIASSTVCVTHGDHAHAVIEAK